MSFAYKEKASAMLASFASGMLCSIVMLFCEMKQNSQFAKLAIIV